MPLPYAVIRPRQLLIQVATDDRRAPPRSLATAPLPCVLSHVSHGEVPGADYAALLGRSLPLRSPAVLADFGLRAKWRAAPQTVRARDLPVLRVCSERIAAISGEGWGSPKRIVCDGTLVPRAHRSSQRAPQECAH